jgi:hypothetical protein
MIARFRAFLRSLFDRQRDYVALEQARRRLLTMQRVQQEAWNAIVWPGGGQVTVYLLVWAEYCGSTDAASLLGVFSTKQKADEAALLEYDLGYHGKCRGTDEQCSIEEVTMDWPMLKALRLI